MSVLNVIRTQENPDGIEGHEERLRIQNASRDNPPKHVFTRGRYIHRYSAYDGKKQFVDKEILLYAKYYCRELCCNVDCPLQGV